MGKSEVGIAVIGTGQRGFGFARFLVGEDVGARLVALCDLDEGRVGSVAGTLGANGVSIAVTWMRW